MRKEYQKRTIKKVKKVKKDNFFSKLDNCSIYSDFINNENLKLLNKFLNLRTFDYKKMPNEKKNRIKFLFFLAQKRSLFTKSGYQICTTKIAKDLEISSQTISNYIKKLEKLGFLICSNSKWKKGKRSKTYKINKNSENLDFCNLMNEFNGFFHIHYHDKDAYKIYKEPYKQLLIAVEEEIKQTNIPSSQTQKVKFASRFKSSPRTFLRIMLTKFDQNFLSEARKENLLETQLSGYIQAFNYSCKANKLKNRIKLVKNKDMVIIAIKDEFYIKLDRDQIFVNKNDKAPIINKISHLKHLAKYSKNTGETLNLCERIIQLQASINSKWNDSKKIRARDVLNIKEVFESGKLKRIKYIPSTTYIVRLNKLDRKKQLLALKEQNNLKIISNNRLNLFASRYKSFI